MPDATDDWATQLRENRAEKDQFLKEHRQSPIPPDDREDFDGLDYFDPDESYRVTATVSKPEQTEQVEMETSDGRTVLYDRVVTFAFELDGERYELHGYRQPHDDGESIFVPFRDKTTGQQTYEDGRYMELEPDTALSAGDEVTLDFNLAYSPFCAFSETFSCPLPPEENWLDTTIEAGEKTY
jgi:uncharacterized protein (DUF1684 family)